LTTQDEFMNDAELSQYDIVFNCTGLGAREFCSDPLVRPIRGQMIRVKAPWIKHFYCVGYNTYIIPK
jgi:D-aspartate oxidase